MRWMELVVVVGGMFLGGGCGSMERGVEGCGYELFVMDTALAPMQLSIVQQVRIAKEAGYSGVSYFERRPERGIGRTEEMIAELGKAGLGIAPVYFGLDVSQRGSARFGLLLETIELLKGVEGGMVWLAVRVPEGYEGPAEGYDEELVTILRELSERAGEVRIALYPHYGNLVETVADAVRVAKKVDRENVGVTFNLAHWLRAERGAELEGTLREAMPYLFAVSINGADADGEDWDRLIQPLGRGSFDVGAVVETLCRLGYSGPIGLQGYGIKGDPRKNIGESMRAWGKRQY